MIGFCDGDIRDMVFYMSDFDISLFVSFLAGSFKMSCCLTQQKWREHR